MRIGIFGCTADPFTDAHMAIVDLALDRNLVDYVCIVPTVVSYHRTDKEPWLSQEDKLKVIEAFVSRTCNRSRIVVCPHEFAFAKANPDKVESRRFIDTLEDFRSGAYESSCAGNGQFLNALADLRADRPDEPIEFSVILGTDSVANFHTWHRHEDILKGCTIIGVRGRNGLKNDIPNETIVTTWMKLDYMYRNVSATAVRSMFAPLKNGLDDYLATIDYSHDRRKGITIAELKDALDRGDVSFTACGGTVTPEQAAKILWNSRENLCIDGKTYGENEVDLEQVFEIEKALDAIEDCQKDETVI